MKQIKKLKMLVSTMLVTVCCLSVSVASFAAEHEWTFSQPWVRPVGNKVIKKFAEDVKKETNGRIEIKVHYDGLMGNHDETFQGVQSGSISIGVFSPYVNLIPGGVLNWMPWTISSWEASKMAFDPNGGPLFNVLGVAYNEVGMHCLFHIAQGPYGIGNTVRPLRENKDFKNLKMRVSGSTGLVRALQGMGKDTGMTAVTLPWSDLYTALSTGVVDGAWTMWPSLVDERHDEVLKYYSDVNFTWDNQNVAINKKLWEKLPKDLQDIVSKVSADSQVYSDKLHREAEAEYIAKVEASGCKIVWLTNEERAALRQASNVPAIWKELCEPWLEKNFPGQNMSAKLQKQLSDIEKEVLLVKK